MWFQRPLVAVLIGLSAVYAAAGPAARAPQAGAVKGHLRVLIVEYVARSTCVVDTNYPRNPFNRHWTVRAGQTINWRYNVNDRVAVVSKPHSRSFPHWGFVRDRRCIGRSVGQVAHYSVLEGGSWVRHRVTYPAGRSVPKSTLVGRSQFPPYWERVDFSPRHGAVPAAEITLGDNATLRDSPDGYVVGNLYAGWKARPTGERVFDMIKVYVPGLRRWGWAQINR